MDGRCSCRAVCDRLLTLLNEEVVEYIRLILRCGSLVWGVIEVGKSECFAEYFSRKCSFGNEDLRARNLLALMSPDYPPHGCSHAGI